MGDEIYRPTGDGDGVLSPTRDNIVYLSSHSSFVGDPYSAIKISMCSGMGG